MVKNLQNINPHNNVIQFFSHIKKLEDFEYLISLIRFYTAPTLLKIKTGTLVNIPCTDNRDLKNCWYSSKKSIESSLGLNSILLKSSEKSLLIYFFNSKKLDKRLKNKHIKNFLEKFGYKDCHNAQSSLEYLKHRFNIGISCPCEVGIFLGYPLRDVIDFYENNKECKCVGYWKCYNNQIFSRIKFFMYDLSKIIIILNTKRTPRLVS